MSLCSHLLVILLVLSEDAVYSFVIMSWSCSGLVLVMSWTCPRTLCAPVWDSSKSLVLNARGGMKCNMGSALSLVLLLSSTALPPCVLVDLVEHRSVLDAARARCIERRRPLSLDLALLSSPHTCRVSVASSQKVSVRGVWVGVHALRTMLSCLM